MGMLNGPALMFLAAASTLLFGLSLLFAWSDTVRGVKEFFHVRRSRSLAVWLIVIAAVGAFGIRVGFCEDGSIVEKLLFGMFAATILVFLLAIVWIVVLFFYSIFANDDIIEFRNLRHRHEAALRDDPTEVNICQATCSRNRSRTSQ